MLQSKQRLLELNAKLADTLTSKGVVASAEETTTALVDKVSDISSGGDDGVLAGLIDRSIESVVIPDGVTSIGDYAFYGCSSLTSITIPDGVTRIGKGAFRYCSSLTSITIPDGVTNIDKSVFDSCSSLTSITIPDGVTRIGESSIRTCTSLISITIPNSVTSIGNFVFSACPKLTNVIIGDGFNANNLNLSASKLIERETMVNMFNALADRTGLTAYTITINKVVGDKLTDEDKAIATVKNWTIIEK